MVGRGNSEPRPVPPVDSGGRGEGDRRGEAGARGGGLGAVGAPPRAPRRSIAVGEARATGGVGRGGAWGVFRWARPGRSLPVAGRG